MASIYDLAFVIEGFSRVGGRYALYYRALINMQASLEGYKNNFVFGFIVASNRAMKFIFCFLAFLFLFCASFNLQLAKAHPVPSVLLVGATLNDLNYEDRNRFKKYTVVERAYMGPDRIKELVEQCNPIAIVIKQPSGGIYEYSSSGEMIKEIKSQSTRQSQMENDSKFNLPKNMTGSMNGQALQSGMEVPVQINGQMKIGYPQNGGMNGGGQQSMLQSQPIPQMNNSIPQMGGAPFFSAFPQSVRPGGMCPPMIYGALRPSSFPTLGPYDGRTFGLGGRYGYFGNTANFGPPPMMMPPQMNQPMPQMNNGQMNQMGGPQMMNMQMQGPPRMGGMNGMSGNPQQNFAVQPESVPPPNFMANNGQPFPGSGVPEYMYPGTSEYSYLPGEGDVYPRPGTSVARQALKQAAGLAQNMAYPFWFDNYLTTDSSAQALAGNSVGTNAGFPNLQFNADTTANASVVAGQWSQTGVGVGSLLLDSILDGRDIREQRQAAQALAAGTPYYYYPDSAYTSYPAMPYQPLPSNAGY
ncbi:MAG: hypothetical protein SFU25_04490 [Candidatus Caenarcaniphilales bacterium]|nr:hypothetical protein [Candidatus Caenarcaniphilales bacterium]